MKGVLNFLFERFGIEKIPEDYVILDRGNIWIASKDVLNVKEKLKFNRIGIRLVRVFKDGYKLTTPGSQVIGKFAKKNVINLSSYEDVLKFLSGEDIPGKFENIERGQVIVKFQDDILGIALYDGQKLKNQIPKSKRIIFKTNS
ncbi:MAG: hypothetical protein ABIL37_02700 [candidate division WOR-3 bacterium]